MQAEKPKSSLVMGTAVPPFQKGSKLLENRGFMGSLAIFEKALASHGWGSKACAKFYRFNLGKPARTFQ
jgi:hypothetical protein